MWDLLAELAKRNGMPGPVRDSMRRNGIDPNEYLRYRRLRPEDRKTLADAGVEWVLRCQEYETKMKTKLRQDATEQADELREAAKEIGEEVSRFLEDAWQTLRTTQTTIKVETEPVQKVDPDAVDVSDDDLWAKATKNPPKDTENDAARVWLHGKSDGVVNPDKEAATETNPEDDPAEEQPKGLVDELERLAKLHKRGVLTKKEFEKAKAKLLEG